MYKNCDESMVAQRDSEIQVVKDDMESEKAQRVLDAKERMQVLKKQLAAEKQVLLGGLKSKLAESRPGQGKCGSRGEHDFGDVEVLDIDDTFNDERSPLRVGEEISSPDKPRRISFKGARASSNSPRLAASRDFAKSLMPTDTQPLELMSKTPGDEILKRDLPSPEPPIDVSFNADDVEDIKSQEEKDEQPEVVEIEEVDDVELDVDNASIGDIDVSK